MDGQVVSAGFTLAIVSGVVGVLAGGALGKLFGPTVAIPLLCIAVCGTTFFAVISAVRNQQSLRARDEYRAAT